MFNPIAHHEAQRRARNATLLAGAVVAVSWALVAVFPDAAGVAAWVTLAAGGWVAYHAARSTFIG